MKPPIIRSIIIFSFVLASIMACTLLSPQPTSPAENFAATDTAATLTALQAQLTANAPTIQPLPQLGGITGALSFPSEFIPPLRVVAFNLSTGESFYVDTTENQTTYTIPELPAGTYHVVAYYFPTDIPIGDTAPQILAAGYSQAVPCGLSIDCTDHSLINVQVVPGEFAQDINPGDWYAPDGTFPSDPTR